MNQVNICHHGAVRPAKMFVYLCQATLALACLFQSGCGDPGPKTYPVKGKIINREGKPVKSGMVLFESVDDPKIQASGDLSSDGTFALDSNLGKPGTVAGKHRVMIEPPLPEYGEKALIANKFASFATSGLTAEVTEGENDLTIELK